MKVYSRVGWLVSGRTLEADMDTRFVVNRRQLKFMPVAHGVAAKLQNTYSLMVAVNIGILPHSGKYLAGQSD